MALNALLNGPIEEKLLSKAVASTAHFCLLAAVCNVWACLMGSWLMCWLKLRALRLWRHAVPSCTFIYGLFILISHKTIGFIYHNFKQPVRSVFSFKWHKQATYLANIAAILLSNNPPYSAQYAVE